MAARRLEALDRPRSAVEWRGMLLEAHRALLAQALPEHAGRFRTTPVAYGHGQHERQGTSPEFIELTLEQCYLDFFDVDRKVRPSGDRKQFVRWAAELLERFFDIHPFVDGNGRVARLVIDFVARHDTAHALRQDGNYRARKRYRNALEYAHRYARGPEQHDGWWVPLASWIDSRLVEVHRSEPDEPPTGSTLRLRDPQSSAD